MMVGVQVSVEGQRLAAEKFIKGVCSISGCLLSGGLDNIRD
jgi:hypothetical protein